MAELNKISCQVQGSGNTGIPDCYLDPKEMIGIILCPLGFKVTSAQMADLQSTLQDATLKPVGSRIYPLINFIGLSADNSEAPVKQTFGYGASLIIRDGNYDLEFQYRDGGLCLHKQLRQFNLGKWSAFLVDAAGILYGFKSGNDLAAIPLEQFFAQKMKFADGSNATSFLVNIVFKPKYLNELVGFLDTVSGDDGFDIQTAVVGLTNVVIKQVTALAAGVVKVKVETSCGGKNLYGTFKTALTDKTAWVVTTASGASVDITTAAGDDAAEAITLTLDTEDTDYPSSGSIFIRLADPDDLADLSSPMSGYESNSLSQTV